MRTNPNFRSAELVVVDTPVTQMGDYHLAIGAFPIDKGAPLAGSPNPATLAHDIDLESRANPVDLRAPGACSSSFAV